MTSLRFGLLVLGSACGVAGAAAPEPQWIAPGALLPTAAPVTFAATLDLPAVPTAARIRVAAYDRYRLCINGTGVSIGDSPWDAETFDVTPLLRAGPNTVEVTAAADVPTPRNCWLWLRRSLPTPGAFSRLHIRTRGATANEWLYVEVLDTAGVTSGFYCQETGRRDLMLGTDGAEVLHTIDLAGDKRLDYQGHAGAPPTCDFARIAAVGLRLDQKDAIDRPRGQLEIGLVRLEGATTLDLTEPGAWRLDPGVGEARRSRLAASPDGALALTYDFTPAADPKIAVDLCAWGGQAELARLVSGPAWQVAQAPVRVTPSPADLFAWTRLALTGPGERPDPPCRAAARLDFGGADRYPEGEPVTARLCVWALAPQPAAKAEVRVESWAGREVLRSAMALAWTGAEAQATLAVPALPRGLYRFTATLDGQPAPADRHAALAIHAPGQKRLSSLYDTLTPLPPVGGLHGIDLSWSDSPALLLGIRDQGVNLLQVHLGPHQLDNGEFDELLAFCRATGLRFALNNESANWSAAAPDPAGRDRFVAPGGCHRWDLEPAALDRAAATGLFEGVVYDEGEHMQLCRNYYAQLPDTQHRQPYLVETTGLGLPGAHAAFTAAARTVAAENRRHGTRMLVESVFPVLWHPLAAAGVALCPKLLKEDLHPVVLAMALGAAKEYGAELWFSPDLWYMDRFPGHSVADYAAALELARAAGVDHVYTEGTWALCRVRDATYELTPYGRVLREFVAARGRQGPPPYSYRDYEPEVAIIRFPDSDWGQADCYYWKTLYGAEDLPPTPVTAEWLQVWHLLTAGQSDPRAVNTNSGVYPRDTWRFDYPAPAVAVYDHLVGDAPLRGVRTLFVCGVTVSDATWTAIRARVRDGAECFVVTRLCPPDVLAQAATRPARVADGQGAWIVVDGFRPADLGPFAARLPVPGPVTRLRFGGRTVPMPVPTAPTE